MPEDGGGFGFWPRSHHRLYRTYPSQHAAGHTEECAPKYQEAIEAIREDTPMHQFTGREGDALRGQLAA